MERSILGEENREASDLDLVSKSVGSSIKIDSISIDLVDNDETNAGKCEHFSIRGFVSEVRKKNRKLCLPFSLDGNHNKPKGETCALPPLHVTKFRWWRCQNCLLEMSSEGNNYSHGNGSNYCSSARSKSNGTCPHVSSLGDAAMLQSGFEPSPKLNIAAGRKVDASIATDLNVNDCCLPSPDDKNGKKSKPKNTPVIVVEICPEDKMNQEIPISAGATKAVPCGLMTGKHHTNEIVSLKTNCNGSVEIWKPRSDSHEAADIELANEKVKYMLKNSVEICQTGEQPSAEGQNSRLTIACGTSRVVGMADEVLDASKGLAIEHPSPEGPELDECDSSSAESDETLPGNHLQDHLHDDSSGSHHSKTQKVRLLTELLAEKGDVKATLTRTESSPFNSVPDSSAGICVLSDLQGTVAVEGNPIRLFNQKKKRKFPHDEARGPLEISNPNNFHKKSRTFTENAETTGVLASSDTKEDAGIDLQIGVKSHLNKFRFDRSPMGKKKNKSVVVDGFLSLPPPRGNIRDYIQNTTADANVISPAGAALLESAQNAFTGRQMFPFPLPQKTERNSSICKKKSKMPQFDECQASPIPWGSGMLRESPARRKDVEIKQTHTKISPFQSSQDATTGKEPQLPLNSCLSTQGYDSKHIYLLEHGHFLSRRGSSKEIGVMGKDIQTNYVGDSDYPSKSESDAFLQKGVHCNLVRENYRMSFMNEKQQSTSQVEAGGHSLMQPMDLCRGNNGKSIEMHERSALTMEPSDQQADKVPEQGVPDDIPMEIVELMAKNQYERCLPDFENERPLETTINTSNASIYAKEKLSFLSYETARKPKPLVKNGRNGKITRSENEGTSKQKPVGFFPHISGKHFDLSPSQQTCGPAGLMPFAHCQGKTPNVIKFSDTSSSMHGSSQNCQWLGNMLGQRASQTNLQTLGACNPCQSVPQQSKETAHLWSSVIPSHVAFIYDIRQKHASCEELRRISHMGLSTNADMLSHCPGPHKGNVIGNHNSNFLNVDVTNIEKHNRTFDSESLSRPRADYPFACKHSRTGPLDVYSNEAIPAMHLLSLMDAGLQSDAPIGIDGNSKFLKRPSFPHDHHSKDFSPLSSEGYKITSTRKPSPYDYFGKIHLSENSHECSPSIKTVGASGFSFQHDNIVKKTACFTGQAPLKHQERDRARASDSPSQNKDNRSQQPVFISGGSGINHGTIPVHNMQKMFVGASDSLVFPLTFHEKENATKQKLESRNTTLTVMPPKSCSKTETCSINRNPADFSMPEAGNIYMIKGEDLNHKKSVFSENISGYLTLEGRKRQKKLTAMKAGKV